MNTRFASAAAVGIFAGGLLLAPFVPAEGKGGGGRGFSSSRSSYSSSSRSAPSKPSSKAPSVKSSPFKASPKASTPAPSSVKNSTFKATPRPTPAVISTGKKPANASRYASSGQLIDNNYRPSFRSGYQAPAGSVVYRERSSALDWLPFYYLATHDSHEDVTVVQPDGKEVKQQEEGVDGMYIVNWILTVLLAIGAIGGIVWLVNKYTKPKGKLHASI